MSEKLSLLLFLAVVCLAGATLADYNASSCPAITGFYPEETSISDTEGSVREFSVTINQAAEVRWLMNGVEVGNESDVNQSTYRNTSAARGYWNVTAYVYNGNGSDTHTWLWTVSDTPVPVAIIGYVVYTDGSSVPNSSVTITNLNTNERFSVKKNASYNYYRAMTSSAHLSPGDRIRFNASKGAKWNETIRNVTAEDITGGSGLFKQNLTFKTEKPDLEITNCSNVADFENKTLSSITYMVENIGDADANASTTTIYLDGVPVLEDPVEPLAHGENFTSTVGPFDFPRNSTLIVVCADNTSAVNESHEDNNCAEVAVNCSLPDLEVRMYREYIPGSPAGGVYVRKFPLIHALDRPNGRYEICYQIYNNGSAIVPSSNVTINITTVATNGSVVSTEIIKHLIPGPARGWWEDYYNNENETNNISKTFTCTPDTTLVVTVCADSDHDHLERNETDNCKEETYVCECEWKPDLKITDHKETWIDKANRIFTIAYTVANIGNVTANASTTRITKSEVWGTCPVNTTFDQVPAIAPGERCTRTITSQGLYGPDPHPPVAAIIKIDADYNDTISESIENNNGVSYTFGLPYLTFWEGMRYWGANRTFSIEYKVQNVWFAGARSQPTTLYADINGNRSDVTSIIPPYNIDKGTDRPPLRTGWFQAPLDVHPANVTYRLCWDGGDGIESCTADTILGCGACVAKDGMRFDSCGEHLGYGAEHYNIIKVSKSCTFESNILAPKGMHIKAHNIVIDGNGSSLVGTGGGTGVDNTRLISWTDRYGYDNVTLQNIDISGFGSAVTIGTGGNRVYDQTIENCLIHDNARIFLTNAKHVRIGNCSIYNDTGGSGISLAGGCYCDIINCSIYNTGGYGILFQDHNDYNYCNVTNSNIYNNSMSGIRAPTSVSPITIRNNLIADNGYCGIRYSCSGINLHWKGGYGVQSNATVERNVIRNNTGAGIYTAHGYPTIKDNIITGCRANESEYQVTGSGILVDRGWMTFLYNNTICNNEGADIADIPRDGKSTTFGDDNTCGYNATDCYDDEGTAGCTFYYDGVSGVCIAEDGTPFSCGDVVTKSCTLNRSMDCRGCGCDGLIAGADDIVINGSNYTITGNLTGAGIVSRHKNVTIMNLQTKDFATGILIETTVDNTIYGCNLRRNRLTGVNITADNCTVSESMAYDNLGPGIAVFGDYNRFTNNTAAQNRDGTLLPGYGFYFGSDARDNTITGNAVGDNEDVDIHDESGNGTSGASDNNTCDDPIHNYWDLSTSLEKTYGCVYPWTPPDLIISKIYPPVWINKANKTYEVEYTIKNIGKPTSREAYPSISWLYIGYFPKADDPVDSLLPGESSDERFDYTITMSDDEDPAKVCADGPDEIVEVNDANKFYRNTVGCYTVEDFFSGDEEKNNCESETFEYEADEKEYGSGGVCMCVGDWCDNVGRPYYVCGDTVTESCTFNGTMRCPTGSCGLRICASGVTIDGNGYALIGDVTHGNCSYADEDNPCEVSGIYNPGYDDVTIQDLTIKGFCSGIAIKDADLNTVERCDIYDNGFDYGDSVTHGIHLATVNDITIHDNQIHDNKGTGAGCGGGGNGIFIKAGGASYHGFVFSDNHLYNNDKTGILCKRGMTGAQITGNEVYKNGDSELDMTAGIRLQCISSDDNDIIGNTVYKNYAEGIVINSHDNTVNGNTICDNKREDIFISRSIDRNHGSGNTCDTTRNFVCELPCKNPDLTISHTSEAWSDFDKLEYEITYTVENVGRGGAKASRVGICINRDDCTDYFVPPLNASDTNNNTNTNTVGPFTISDSLVDEIRICADCYEQIEESEEGSDSNCNESIWYAKPDLTVTAFDVPGAGNLTLFTDSTANATIANIGTISTKGAFDVTLYINEKEEGTFRVPELASGDSVTLSFKWLVGASNLLRVVADSEEEIDEWDEGNNDAIETRSLNGGKPPGNLDTKTPHTHNGLPPDAPNSSTVLDLDSEGVGGNWEYDETIGNESASGRVSKERVHAQMFKSIPFLPDVSDIVVSYNGLVVLGALFIAMLFYFGYRGEIAVLRRNNR